MTELLGEKKGKGRQPRSLLQREVQNGGRGDADPQVQKEAVKGEGVRREEAGGLVLPNRQKTKQNQKKAVGGGGLCDW